MKTLILCVDRDDDLGTKGGVRTPVVGRRRNLDAAIALGLADPEDSDTNALLAAVHLYDKELAAAEGAGNPVEVATIAGHKGLGLKADRKLAQELEDVLALVRPEEVILVSDGAEDEQILPILQSRAKVVHVHRSVVKQAPRLEGFYYVITRILDDEKQAKRFVLPFGIILLIWGTSYLMGWQGYAWGASLGVLGLWLVVHAMKWETRVGRFFSDLGSGLKAGWLSGFALLAMLVILGIGAVLAWKTLQAQWVPLPEYRVPYPRLRWVAVFVREFWWYLVSALLVLTAGRMFDALARTGRAGMRHAFAAFTLIALGFLGSVALDFAVGWLQGQDLLLEVADLPRMVQLVAGLALLAGLMLVRRYVRSFATPGRMG